MDNRSLIRLLPIALALIAAAYTFLSTPTFKNPETGRRSKIALDPKQEQTLGLQAYQQVLSKSEILKDGPVVGAVTEVAQRLAGATKAQLPWQLSVVREDQVNAFCLPGGEIVVYTAILPVTQSRAGLAVVLGHEMAHATSHHGSARMFKQNITQTLMSGAQFSLYNMDYQQQQMAMAALGAFSKYGVSLPFSRTDESEADHIGLIYMARAGYDPRQAVEFWKRMAKRTGSGQPPQFASDHPSHETRIQDIQGWLPEALKEYERSQKVPEETQNAPIGN